MTRAIRDDTALDYAFALSRYYMGLGKTKEQALENFAGKWDFIVQLNEWHAEADLKIEAEKQAAGVVR